MFPQFTPITASIRKFVRSLHRKTERDETKQFLVEGVKLCAELFESAYKTALVIIRSNASIESKHLAELYDRDDVPVYECEGSKFDYLCDATTPQDILAIVHYPENESNPLSDKIIILDKVTDPGNVGTIIRTADWFGFSTVILGEGCADRFNPKVVRSTMGSIFRLNIKNNVALTPFLQDIRKDYMILGALLNGNTYLHQCKPFGKLALVFGNESKGISSNVESLLTDSYIIQGFGKAESLNVSVAAGIAMFHFSAVEIQSK